MPNPLGIATMPSPGLGPEGAPQRGVGSACKVREDPGLESTSG